MITAEWWHEILIHQIQIRHVLREGVLEVTRLVQSRCSFEEHVGILESLQTLHDVRRFATLGALDEKLFHIDRKQENTFACLSLSIATETQIIVVHGFERWPIL